MRTLALADRLRKELDALKVLFICRAHTGHLQARIMDSGFDVALLPLHADESALNLNRSLDPWLGTTEEQDAEESIAAITQKLGSPVDWLIVDHYELSHAWESRLRQCASRVFVIDDLANRRHSCDLLLDQTFSVTSDRYRRLTPSGCQILTGTEYALLREEFEYPARIVLSLREKSWPPTRLLVSLGGGDIGNVAAEVLHALTNCRFSFQSIVVIAGPSFAGHEELQGICRTDARIRVHIDPSDIATIMLHQDLCIGAAGTTAWERCAIGLPTIMLVTADNQQEIANRLENTGAVRRLSRPVQPEELESALEPWLCQKDEYMRAVSSGLGICDARGVKRVVRVMMQYGANGKGHSFSG